MKTTKTYSVVNSDKLADYLKETQTSVASFAFKIGVSQGCVSKWISSEKMPQYMGVMIDALAAPSNNSDTISVIVSGESEAINAVIVMAMRMQLQSMKLDL